MKTIYSPTGLIISAFLTGLGHHPLQLGFLPWFGLLPLIFVYNRITEMRHFIITGMIWGFTYHLTVIFWLVFNIGTIPSIGILSTFIAVTILTFNIVVVSFIMGIVKKYYPNNWFYILPFIWTSIEYLRSLGTMGFPWTSLANTQLDYLTLVQNAEISGIYGISFWVVSINILLFNFLVRPFPENSFKVLFFFIFPWLTGLWLTPSHKVDHVNSLDVAVVQPNIHLSDKRKPSSLQKNIESLLNDSKPAINNNIDLIIWPETSISSYPISEKNYYIKSIQSQLKESKLIFGIPYYFKDKNISNSYNSAMLMNKESIQKIYHKHQLVPGPEYIPLTNYFPFLMNLDFGQNNIARGTEYTIMEVNKVKCAVMICFESTFPNLSREFVNKGAEILIYLVNDGWYEHPPEPQQHARQAIYRAVENRRPVIRCTNTGISMIIDSRGNISDEIPLNQKGMMEATIHPQNIDTFYIRHGDIFARLNVFLSIIFILGGMVRKK